MGIFGDGQRRRVAAKAYKPASEILQVLCDGCHAAWAKVEVITGAGSVFLCQHHHKKYRNSIIAAGHQIRAALGHPRPKPMPGCLDLGSGAVSPARASHALARFQLLVGQEEVLDSSRSNSPGRGCRVGIPDAGHRRGRIGPCRRPPFRRSSGTCRADGCGSGSRGTWVPPREPARQADRHLRRGCPARTRNRPGTRWR